MSVSEAQPLLHGLRVLDLAGEPAQMVGRLLGDLGADVVRARPSATRPVPERPTWSRAWDAGTRVVQIGAGDPALDQLLAGADVVIDTPGWPATLAVEPARAPGAVWLRVTPFGLDGPRSHWRAADLGVMASTGNMYATGDPDRPPVRCTEPSGYAHAGPEAAFAALTAIASGRPQIVDVSMQEVVLVASMGSVGRFARTPFRGRRSGASVGRTREIWPCKDGFVSFGLRGGKARVPNLQTITRLLEEAGLGSPALSDRDWTTYNHNTVSDEELRAIEEPISRYLVDRTMAELYEIACDTNLMLAPANSPRELYASAQLAARDFFGPHDDIDRFPLSFIKIRSADSLAAPARPRRDAERATAGGAEQSEADGWPVRKGPERWGPAAGGGDRSGRLREGPGPSAGGGSGGAGGNATRAWAGTNILEFGSGAAGPIATRYFAEHGATVIRVESKSRPDFLRVYALGPKNPHGLEGSDMFDALNVGKLGITLNMKHPRGVELAKRLTFEWAEALSENFAPKAMRGFGMDYDTLAAQKPDLVMVSACLQGQTGPHRNYPGFGGQGAALSGYNFLTGWPDRDPLGPHGTITDSLAPRFAAAALAAGLLFHRRTGRGVYLDLSQVEAAAWSLSPWLLDYAVDGTIGGRLGNDNPRARLHGAFPCAGDDRWLSIAAWDDDDVARLAKVVGTDASDRAALEAAVSAWTSSRAPLDAAEELQAAGVQAVPVADFGDVYADPQLAHRGHLVRLTHPFLGEGAYERNGFRLSEGDGGYDRPSPTLGQDNAHVLGDILGLSTGEQEQLAADGVLE